MHEKDFKYLGEMWGQSDRSAAIVGAAFLEDKLTDCIGSRLVDDKDTREKLFKPNKPIGNFGVKAELGFMLGLYNAETRDEIARVAKIRNWFAHWAEPTTFDTKEVRAECAKLILNRRFMNAWGLLIANNWGDEALPTDLRERAKFQYLRFVDMMGTFLDVMSKEVKRPEPNQYRI